MRSIQSWKMKWVKTATPHKNLLNLYLNIKNIKILIWSNFNYVTHATNKLCAFENIKCFGFFKKLQPLVYIKCFLLSNLRFVFFDHSSMYLNCVNVVIFLAFDILIPIWRNIINQRWLICHIIIDVPRTKINLSRHQS